MSSTAAFKPMAGLVLYGATKAFVKELSLGLRLELSGHGVDVCVVFPGPVRTAMVESALGRPVAPGGPVGGSTIGRRASSPAPEPTGRR